MEKQNFEQPLIQSSVSQDPSEIILIFWFGAQETFLITVEIAVLLNIFEEKIKKYIYILLSILPLFINLMHSYKIKEYISLKK